MVARSNEMVTAMILFVRAAPTVGAFVFLAGCGSGPGGGTTPRTSPSDNGAGPASGSSDATAPTSEAGSGSDQLPSGADAPAGGPSGQDAGGATPPTTSPDATAPGDASDGGSSHPLPTCAAGATLPAGDTNGMLQVGGTARTYILHVPSNLPAAKAVPLVIDFHPILSTNTFEEGNSGYKALADQEGFVVAFPQGIDDAWNIGPCCTMSRTVDDLGFTKALVAKIEAAGCIDPKRVYAVGYSMGGGMSHYLACNAADVFAAVAPAAFDLLEESEEPCHPARPITEISFRGTADPIVPYDGGASNPPNGLAVTIHFLGAQGTFQKWAQLDQCTGTPSVPDSNGCSTYSQCAAGVEATLCTKQGGGHDTGNPQIGWAMLKAHPMP